MDKNDAVGITLLGISGCQPQPQIKSKSTQHQSRRSKPRDQLASQRVKPLW